MSSLITCSYKPNKYGNIPSLLQGYIHKVFQRILTFFVKAPAKILDCTCGPKFFWRNWQNNKLDGKYEVVFSDVRKLGHVQADFFNLPFKDECFDCVVFDPPYQDRWRFNLEKVKRPGRLYLENPYSLSEGCECFTPNQLDEVKAEFWRVLRPQGILIMKLADHRTRNIWWQPEVFKRMTDLFKILDVIIYVRPKGSLFPPVYFIKRNNISTLIHAYFFILKKVIEI